MCISPHSVWIYGRRSPVKYKYIYTHTYKMGVLEQHRLPESRKREEGEGERKAPAHQSHTYTDQGHTLPPFPHDPSGKHNHGKLEAGSRGRSTSYRRSTWPTYNKSLYTTHSSANGIPEMLFRRSIIKWAQAAKSLSILQAGVNERQSHLMSQECSRRDVRSLFIVETPGAF